MKTSRAVQTKQERKRGVRPLIAIVDDDESVREALRSFFKSMDLQTELFACAEDFLDSSHLGDMSCLILDVLMPGMDGLELQRQLAARQLIRLFSSRDRRIKTSARRPCVPVRSASCRSHSARRFLLKAVRTALEGGGGGKSRFR